jgi:hypothetical protein
MKEMLVERDFEKPDEWNVFESSTRWLASFVSKELAEEYAEWKRLEA